MLGSNSVAEVEWSYKFKEKKKKNVMYNIEIKHKSGFSKERLYWKDLGGGLRRRGENYCSRENALTIKSASS